MHPKWDQAKWDQAKWDQAKWDATCVPTRWTLGVTAVHPKWDPAKWDPAKWDQAKWDATCAHTVDVGGDCCAPLRPRNRARRCVRRYKRCKKAQGQPKVDRRQAGRHCSAPPTPPNGRVMNAAGGAPARPYLLDQSCGRRPKGGAHRRCACSCTCRQLSCQSHGSMIAPPLANTYVHISIYLSSYLSIYRSIYIYISIYINIYRYI